MVFLDGLLDVLLDVLFGWSFWITFLYIIFDFNFPYSSRRIFSFYTQHSMPYYHTPI